MKTLDDHQEQLKTCLPPCEFVHIKHDNVIKMVKIGNYEFKEGDYCLSWNNVDNFCWTKICNINNIN